MDGPGFPGQDGPRPHKAVHSRARPSTPHRQQRDDDSRRVGPSTFPSWIPQENSSVFAAAKYTGQQRHRWPSVLKRTQVSDDNRSRRAAGRRCSRKCSKQELRKVVLVCQNRLNLRALMQRVRHWQRAALAASGADGWALRAMRPRCCRRLRRAWACAERPVPPSRLRFFFKSLSKVRLTARRGAARAGDAQRRRARHSELLSELARQDTSAAGMASGCPSGRGTTARLPADRAAARDGEARRRFAHESVR